MPMKLLRYLETKDQAMKFLCGFINIVNPLSEHSRANYCSHDEINGVRSTRVTANAVAAPATFVVI